MAHSHSRLVSLQSLKPLTSSPPSSIVAIHLPRHRQPLKLSENTISRILASSKT
ncbi:hypothetical protein COLO4_09207 [Corchorus olitorius]|uniref:Uncharacterized protein n=1 Tax=Corchorus olitorius TaxID=93759 RepID=A0A1R3KCS7_9ROSI|nr:hypothetical protein COLO4_09207 [Corchorus olitorius]